MLKVQKLIRGILWKSGIGNKLAKSFWKKKRDGKEFNYLYRNQKKVFTGIPVNFEDNSFSDFIAKDSAKWDLQEEYVLQIHNVLVEPERCIGIIGFNNIIEQTTILNNQFPYFIPYVFKRWNPSFLEEAVLYDGYASKNYYHHLLNAVNSIHMLEKVSFPANIPFIISEEIYNHKFFQHLYHRSEKFRNINWFIQKPNDWYKVNKLYRLQCLHFDAVPWQKTVALYNLPARKSFKKIFLSRDTKRFSRGLSNEEQISSFLAKYGFETLYAENLSLDEQLEVFQTTKYLIALHGAGLVQQVFMNYSEAHVIEVLPKNQLMPLYYWQAFTLGIKYYDVIVGGNLDDRQMYHLDIAILEKAVNKMLNNKYIGKVYGDSHLAN